MDSIETDPRRGRLEHPCAPRARAMIEEWDEETVERQVELTEIPAPPFGEEARGARMAELLEDAGLVGVRVDEVGNVLAELPSTGDGTPVPESALVVAAHLDTVFPEGTDVRVRREDDRLVGPGIADDGRGLAALLTLARVLVTLEVPLVRRVLFVATVGEEGAGNLRGVRHLFSDEAGGGSSLAAKAAGFVSLDGAGLGRIVTRGLGVRRLRLTVSGPGGHSWTDRDAPNPIQALARAVSAMSEFELPGNPPVGLTVSRWEGGTSINAVPREAWVELDLRSESGNYLRALEDRVRRLSAGAVAAENATARGRDAGRGHGRDAGSGHGRDAGDGLSLEVQVIGDRPAGATDPDSALVQAAVEATRAVNQEPELVASSTDSNIPMATGIPAITMGAGGEAGNSHTPDEWYRNRNGPEGIFRAFLTVVLAAGIR